MLICFSGVVDDYVIGLIAGLIRIGREEPDRDGQLKWCVDCQRINA